MLGEYRRQGDLRRLFCTPTEFTSLPLPFVGPSLSNCRFPKDRISFQGRTFMTKLLAKFSVSDSKEIQIGEFFNKMVLYGTSGGGKSHAAAMLAITLLAEGVPVAYIPDCRVLEVDFFRTIRASLLMSFANDDAICDRLIHADPDADPRQLTILIRSIQQPIFWVVDQADFFDSAPEGRQQARMQLYNALQELIGPSTCLRVYSANDRTAKFLGSRNPDHDEATVFGGFDKVCKLLLHAAFGSMSSLQTEYKAWLHRYFSKVDDSKQLVLDNDQQHKLLWATGAVPLELKEFLNRYRVKAALETNSA